MNAIHLLTGPLSQSIGWALLHLLWQATIVAGILAAVLALVPRQAATTRYAAACGALALVFVMFIGTAVRSYDPGARVILTAAQQHLSADEPTRTVALSEVPALIAATATAGWRDQAMDAVATARQSLPSIVAFWLAGVVLLSSRLLLSFLRARRLATHGTSEAGAQWQRAATRISEALGLRRAVRLLESAAVEVPSVLGTLRPVILLPASTLTGLTPEQIEMVIAHELAHIRRHDFFINLLQAFVETLMFYHPAVWWMSRSVRIERENCCDDLAVAVCGNPIQYARALTRLEELRGGALPVVVAANGASLLDRIRRIAEGRAESTGASARWAAAVVVFVGLGIALALPSLPALAQRDDPPAKTVKAKPAKAQIDVVETVRPEAVETEGNVDPLDTDPPDTDTPMPVVDIDMPDVDMPDIDIAMPDMPPLPAIPVYPALAPMALTPPTPPPTPLPTPAMAPLAMPSIAPTPRPGPTPRAPRAPLAMAAMLAGGYDFDSDAPDDSENGKDFGASGKLTVDELIQLRATGVTPEYISQMRAVFPDLSLRSLAQLHAVGVTPGYIKEMRDAGFEIKSARDAQTMRAVGVTGKWLQTMRDAGMDIKTSRDAQTLRAVGVTGEWLRAMHDAGMDIKTSRDAQTLRAVGVTGEWLRAMHDAGMDIESARDAQTLRAVGVTDQWLRAMRDAGMDAKSARDAQTLRAVGVTGEWLRAMRDAGVDIKTARDASTLRAVGASPKFVQQLREAGYTNLSVRELSRLAAAGIDGDFIREMEQYRTKK